MRRRRLLLPLLAAALAVGTAGVRQAEAQPLETSVKAAFLPKFMPYVSWPPTATPEPGAPYVICVVGRDPFGTLLDDAASGERPSGSPIAVRRLERIDRASGCHVAFIGGSDSQPVDAALATLSATPVLTVTDARLARDRGMVHFDLRGGRVRFHIDDAAARRSGLGLSSKLLSLALSVRQRRARG
jgi:hypothetical protein